MDYQHAATRHGAVLRARRRQRNRCVHFVRVTFRTAKRTREGGASALRNPASQSRDSHSRMNDIPLRARCAARALTAPGRALQAYLRRTASHRRLSTALVCASDATWTAALLRAAPLRPQVPPTACCLQLSRCAPRQRLPSSCARRPCSRVVAPRPGSYRLCRMRRALHVKRNGLDYKSQG